MPLKEDQRVPVAGVMVLCVVLIAVALLLTYFKHSGPWGLHSFIERLTK